MTMMKDEKILYTYSVGGKKSKLIKFSYYCAVYFLPQVLTFQQALNLPSSVEEIRSCILSMDPFLN